MRVTFYRYQQAAARTADLSKPPRERRLVSTLGLAGEAGEVVDLIKKFEGHGHPVDTAKLKEELGDLLWYVAEVASCYGLDLEAIARHNVDKLKRRYPSGFTHAASLARVDTP